MVNVLIFIGGISASGKSTIKNKLNELPKFKNYRFHDFVKNEMHLRGLNYRNVAPEWHEIASMASKKFLKNFPNNKYSLCDIHYAVQPIHDGLLATKTPVISENIDEPYVCGVDEALLSRLLHLNTIKTKAVLVRAPLREIIERRVYRQNDGQQIRSLSESSILREQKKEEYFFNYITDHLSINSIDRIILDNSHSKLEFNIDMMIRFSKG